MIKVAPARRLEVIDCNAATGDLTKLLAAVESTSVGRKRNALFLHFGPLACLVF